jgi:tetratricopeptide (TPR) repeat protein
MGKSRLVAEFVRAARRRGLLVAFGECQSFGTSTSYFVWREIWRRLFGLEDHDPLERQRQVLADALAAIDPGLVPRAPLLAQVLGVDIPETELTAGLDAKVRKASLEDLLATCLRARSEREPLVLVLEDGHWIDQLSQELLVVLGRATAARPVLIVLAYRPAATPGGDLGVERIPDFEELVLEELGGEEATALIRTKLEQVLGSAAEAEAAAPSDALVELVTERSGGNPFYIEELVTYIAGRGVDLRDATAVAELELPESLHSLVLSRIDQMPESPRRTLKVASVVGRVFEAPLLPGAYPELGELPEVLGNLDSLRAADLVLLDRAAEQAYLFKHVATQEVAYESLPFGIRTMLHGRIGAYLEASDPGAIEHRLDLLAHHFWRSDDEERKRHYLGRAAEAARKAYANEAAIRYLERLAPMLEGRERVDALLQLGQVLELTGEWTRAESVAREALDLAETVGDGGARGWSLAALAEVARKQGRYDEARGHLDAARQAFTDAHADDGLGRVLHLAGTLAAQQGDYDEAERRYRESLGIRERLDDRASMGGLYSNLGVIAEYRGDYEAARAANMRALELRTAVGDRWAIGVSENNLGMLAIHEQAWDEARDRFERSIRLNREIGDAWMVAIGQNNLGNALRGLGDLEAARREYGASLDAYRDFDDRWALAFLLEDIGVLAALAGDDVAAHRVIGAAEAVRTAIGSPRAPGLESELSSALATGRARLGEERAAAAIEEGRTLSPDAAIDLAADICAAA